MNKPRQIPWPKITAEAFAVVISILLAFGIDAWWSNRQEERLADESLAALRDELSANIDELQHEREFREAVIASVAELFRIVGTDAPPDEANIDELLEDISWGGRIDASTGALVSILESGTLASIDDGALKRSVSSLPELYETTALHERSTTTFLENELLLYINRSGSILQIYNAGVGQGRPGGGGELAVDEQFPTMGNTKHSSLLESAEFLGLLAMTQSKHENVLLYYRRLEEAMQSSITLIDEHLR
ncbi:MAG: hypothetical protein AAGH76_03020 [Pseudomonadota bacterium]